MFIKVQYNTNDIFKRYWLLLSGQKINVGFGRRRVLLMVWMGKGVCIYRTSAYTAFSLSGLTFRYIRLNSWNRIIFVLKQRNTSVIKRFNYTKSGMLEYFYLHSNI